MPVQATASLGAQGRWPFRRTGFSEAALETGVAADHVVDAAGELSRSGETLRTQVDAFLCEVRAALGGGIVRPTAPDTGLALCNAADPEASVRSSLLKRL